MSSCRIVTMNGATGNASEPLFKFASGAPLTRPLLVSRLRTFLQQMGDDPSVFSGHSFKSGAATTAAQLEIFFHLCKYLHRCLSCKGTQPASYLTVKAYDNATLTISSSERTRTT